MRRNLFFTPTRCSSCEADLEGGKDVSEAIPINEYRLLIRCRTCGEWTPTWSIVAVPKRVEREDGREVLGVKPIQVKSRRLISA